MKKSRLLGSVCACLFPLITTSANAALIGRLPTTQGGSDYQAYYDDQLGITWVTNSKINGVNTWDEQFNWIAGLAIAGVSDWRLLHLRVNLLRSIITSYIQAN